MTRFIKVVISLSAVFVAFGACGADAKGPLPEPDEGPDPRGLTVTASGVASLKKPARLTESAIERAERAAQPAARARALDEAHSRAVALAAAAGLTLGEPRAVTLRDPSVDVGYPTSGNYCFRSRAGGRSRLRCRFPVVTVATVTVTYATAETTAATSAGRILVATGTGTAPVRPLNRGNSASIRRALLSARLAASPLAVAAVRENVQSLGRASGTEPGAVFSLAEVQRPFDDIRQGSFGPGRYCGEVTRAIFGKRDPNTRRRRVLRRVRQRRCFFSSEVSSVLRVTVFAR